MQQYGDARPESGSDRQTGWTTRWTDHTAGPKVLTAGGFSSSGAVVVRLRPRPRSRLSGTGHTVPELRTQVTDLSAASTRPAMPACLHASLRACQRPLRRDADAAAATSTDICTEYTTPCQKIQCHASPPAGPAPQSLTKTSAGSLSLRPSTFRVLIYGPNCLEGKSLLQPVSSISFDLPSLVRPPRLGTG